MIEAIPRATMRLQFHKDFTFDDAARQVPYLRDLGISHLYASPILTARAGSLHGYDVVDPRAVNPELGGEDGLKRLVETLRAHDLGLIVDIVPNHMAVGGSDNRYWLDVLEWGTASPYADFFDVDWSPPDTSLTGKILAPFLGKPYGEALADGDIKLVAAPDGGFAVHVHDDVYPVDPRTYGTILSHLPGSADMGHRFGDVLPGDATMQAKAALGTFLQSRGDALATVLAAFNDEPGRGRLHALLERQNYRLAWWRAAADAINWRRFFDVNSLGALQANRDHVFDETHGTTLRLYEEGLIDGLRVDHVDGIADPGAYCRRLRAALDERQSRRPPDAPGGRAWLVIEKILAAGETLDSDWQVDGTTGYDFMNDVSAVLHDPAAAMPLAAHWHHHTGRPAKFEVEELAARREIVARSFGAQLDGVVAAVHAVALADIATRDLTPGAIRRCLMELLAHCPAYRAYSGVGTPPGPDAWISKKALDGALATAFPADADILPRIASWLSGEGAGRNAALLREAIRRFEQLSAPVAAKAVEDTAFYRYGRLLSRTDVGFDPGRFSMPVADFHAACLRRAKHFPQAMLATATHDHKRGEDVRARLAALSGMTGEWIAAADRWTAMNARFRQDPHGPTPLDEIVLYQTLLAIWPPEWTDGEGKAAAGLVERVAAWQEKAIREAKLSSSWEAPDAAYEAAARGFMERILTDPASDMPAEIAALSRRLDAAGRIAGVSQLLLKMTVPGVPDFYQGTDYLDLSLVDPDNRRPVDFAARAATLHSSSASAPLAPAQAPDILKQRVAKRVLDLRRHEPDLFASGIYEPMTIAGRNADQFIAFRRRHEDATLIVVVPCRFNSIDDETFAIRLDFLSEEILETDGTPGVFTDQFSGRDVTLDRDAKLSLLLTDFPAALLLRSERHFAR